MEIPNILIIAFILTFVSGLYIFSPLVIDATIIHFGFPLPWLEAQRGEFGRPFSPWRLTFQGLWFIVDFVIYGLITTIALSIYEKKLEHISKPKIYRIFFWLSSIVLVLCCWIFIFWNSIYSLPFLFDIYFLRQLDYNYLRVESFLRFLLGVMTIIFTWFLIKYLKQVSTPLATSSD
jgi:hypothetical protein